MISFRYFGVWLKRFRKRCGYGVHSPFAFNFITGVVFEKGSYYAFLDLDKVYASGIMWRFSHERKCLHFLFRLANFVHPALILCDHSITPAEEAYLSAGSMDACWKHINKEESIPQLPALLCVDAQQSELDALLVKYGKNLHSDSAFLIKVSSAEERRRCVDIVRQNPSCGITFDLYHYILVFFNHHLIKQHYVVNFMD